MVDTSFKMSTSPLSSNDIIPKHDAMKTPLRPIPALYGEENPEHNHMYRISKVWGHVTRVVWELNVYPQDMLLMMEFTVEGAVMI